LVAALSMCGYAILQDMSGETRTLVFLFSFYLFFSALLNSLFALFKSHEELQHESQITLVMNVALLVALAMIGTTGAAVELVVLAFVVSRILGFVLAIIKSKKILASVIPIWDSAWFWDVWKEVSLFGVFFVFGNLYFLLDTILLSMWKGDYDVGIYQSVYRIIALVLVLPEIIVQATLPSLSRLYGSDHPQWVRLGSTMSRILYHIALFLGFALILGAEPIVEFIYGLDSYGAGVPVLRIFGAVVIVRYIVEIPALLLTTSQQHQKRTIIVVAATVVNFGLNFYAIPRFGIEGAATVSFITNLLVGFGYIFAVRGVYREIWMSREKVWPLVVLIAAAVLIILIPNVPLWLGLLSTTLAYCWMVLEVGYSVEEKQLMFQSVSAVFRP
jgi:O-antigen/teichoic acid export membrane protein